MKNAQLKRQAVAAEREPQVDDSGSPNPEYRGPELRECDALLAADKEVQVSPPAPECASGPPAGTEGPQEVPQSVDQQPRADAVAADATALFGVACAAILRRAELTEERPPFAASALRCLATRPGRGSPHKKTTMPALRMRAAGASWRQVYAALSVPSGHEQQKLRDRCRQHRARARRRAELAERDKAERDKDE